LNFLEDKPLIDACLAGERAAQYTLYKKYAKAMYNVCLRIVNDKMDAEDVMQMGFVVVFKKLNSFRYESTLGAWIKRIMVHQCITFLRSKKMEWVSDDNIPESIEEIEHNDVEYNVQVIKDAMVFLSDGYRSIFTLYAIEGYDHVEISQILNISENTSKSQYSRAKVKLHDIIKSNGLKHKIFNS